MPDFKLLRKITGTRDACPYRLLMPDFKLLRKITGTRDACPYRSLMPDFKLLREITGTRDACPYRLLIPDSRSRISKPATPITAVTVFDGTSRRFSVSDTPMRRGASSSSSIFPLAASGKSP